MVLSQRLRTLREFKQLSRIDIEADRLQTQLLLFRVKDYKSLMVRELPGEEQIGHTRRLCFKT